MLDGIDTFKAKKCLKLYSYICKLKMYQLRFIINISSSEN